MVIRLIQRFLGVLTAGPFMLTLRFAKEYRGATRFYTVPVGSREGFNRGNPFIKAVPHLEAVPTFAVYGKHIVYLKMVDPTFGDIVYFAKNHEL